jgi:CheY-like chemotaxis protein
MKILAVEDDPVARQVLVRALTNLGHEVHAVVDGIDALAYLETHPVRLVVSDWVMPEVDGLALCRRLRARLDTDYTYFILLSSRDATNENQREAAEAGVDDFLQKPLAAEEIWRRLHVAERILRFATQVRQLEACLPMCGYCKKIRDDQNDWHQIDTYIIERTGTDFSHAVCPDCYQGIVVPELETSQGRDGATAPDPAAKPSAKRTH